MLLVVIRKDRTNQVTALPLALINSTHHLAMCIIVACEAIDPRDSANKWQQLRPIEPMRCGFGLVQLSEHTCIAMGGTYDTGAVLEYDVCPVYTCILFHAHACMRGRMHMTTDTHGYMFLG